MLHCIICHVLYKFCIWTDSDEKLNNLLEQKLNAYVLFYYSFIINNNNLFIIPTTNIDQYIKWIDELFLLV